MKQLEEENYQRAAERASIRLRVFLAGPYINPKILFKDYSDQHTDPAARIRHYLFARLQEENEITATLGEHERLQQIYQEHFGELNNAAVAEMAHVAEKTDCVILLPSSPGSFCELGYFCVSKKVCRKMLIIVDKQYEFSRSYLSLGPLKMAVDNGSTARFVSYLSDHDMWDCVSKFLVTRKNSLLIQKYMLQ